MGEGAMRRKQIYAWARGDAVLLSALCAKNEERIASLTAALHRAGDRLMQVQPAIDVDCAWALGIVPQAQDEIAAELAKPTTVLPMSGPPA